MFYSLVGLGFGLMSGAYSLMNVLADVLGPGTVGLHGEPQVTIFYSLVFVLSTYLVTLCMIILLLIQNA